MVDVAEALIDLPWWDAVTPTASMSRCPVVHDDAADPVHEVGRKGRVADVADLITYLCRAESGYITGATYDVNGGAHIH